MLGKIIVGVWLLACLYLCTVPFRLLTDVWLKFWEPTPGNTDRETSSNGQASTPTPTPPSTTQPATNVTHDPKPSIPLGSKHRPFHRPYMSPPSTIPDDIFERPPQYSLFVAPKSDISSVLPKSLARTPRSSCDRYRGKRMVPGYEPRTSRVEVLRVEKEPKNFILTRLGARIGLLRGLRKNKKERVDAASKEVVKGGGMLRIGRQVAVLSMSDEQGGDSVDEARYERNRRGSVRLKRKLRDTGRALLELDKEMWAGAIRGEDVIRYGAHSDPDAMLEGTHKNNRVLSFWRENKRKP